MANRDDGGGRGAGRAGASGGRGFQPGFNAGGPSGFAGADRQSGGNGGWPQDGQQARRDPPRLEQNFNSDAQFNAGSGFPQEGDRRQNFYRGGRGGRFRGRGRGRRNPDELSAAQARLVQETALAVARQFAELPRQPVAGALEAGASLTTNSGIAPSANATAAAGIINAAKGPVMASVTEASTSVPRLAGNVSAGAAERALYAVAGVAAKGQDDVDVQRRKMSKCFRCDQPGHCLNDCTAVLCDCCQKADHVTRDCPLIRAPKPSMIVHGVAHEEIMFWEFPLTGAYRPRLENTRMGRVIISNGIMTIPQIITQLQWIVPDEHYQWDVQLIEDNVYRVNFPSKLDLVRAQHFGSYTDPISGISMKFDFWRRDIQPAWEIEKIWVRVHDLPSHALDDFLGLWAMGELFGKTLDVDMAFTRKYDILRIHIACLDPSFIASRLDVLIKDAFYKLRFEVEGVKPIVDQEVVMEDVDDQNNDHGNDANGLGGKQYHGGVDKPGLADKGPASTPPTAPQQNVGQTNVLRFGAFVDGKVVSPSKNSWADLVEEDELANDNAKSSSSCSANGPGNTVLPQCELEEPGPHDLADIVVQQASAVGIRLNEPVMDDTVPAGSMRAVGPAALSIEDGPKKPVVVGGPPSLDSGVRQPASGSPLRSPRSPARAAATNGQPARAAEANGLARQHSGSVSPSAHIRTSPPSSLDKAIAFGGIPAPSTAGVRSSGRIRAQPNADATQMERAMLNAQRRDSLHGQGYSLDGALDSAVVMPTHANPAGIYGYWMFPSADGYAGFLQPGWLAAY